MKEESQTDMPGAGALRLRGEKEISLVSDLCDRLEQQYNRLSNLLEKTSELRQSQEPATKKGGKSSIANAMSYVEFRSISNIAKRAGVSEGEVSAFIKSMNGKIAKRFDQEARESVYSLKNPATQPRRGLSKTMMDTVKASKKGLTTTQLADKVQHLAKRKTERDRRDSISSQVDRLIRTGAFAKDPVTGILTVPDYK